MSCATSIHFYTKRRDIDAAKIIEDTLAYFGGGYDFVDATSYTPIDEDQDSDDWIIFDAVAEESREKIGRNEAVGMICPDRYLSIRWFDNGSGLLGKFSKKIWEGVPESVRGETCPIRSYLYVGAHCIYGNQGAQEIKIEEVSASAVLQCDRVPYDLEKFERSVRNLEVTKCAIAKLREIWESEIDLVVYTE